jgi:ribose 5-phosphate isomerase B
MKIYFASDHAGFELKQALMEMVTEEMGFAVEDCGAFVLDPNDDYPDFVKAAAAAVSDNPEENLAIILGGSGMGEAIVANRFVGVRAAVYYGGNPEIVSLSREHNDSNVLSLGARFLTEEEAREAVTLWLEAPFSGEERHIRRIEKIDSI